MLKPRLTFVIPSLRPDKLNRLMLSLANASTVRAVNCAPAFMCEEFYDFFSSSFEMVILNTRFVFIVDCAPAFMCEEFYELYSSRSEILQMFPSGVISAVRYGFERVETEFVGTLSDDCIFENGLLEEIHSKLDLLGEYDILSPKVTPPYNFQYFGIPFAPFPIVRTESVRPFSLFDSRYTSFYADPHLSLLFQKDFGGKIMETEAPIIHNYNPDEIHLRNVRASREKDKQLFLDRWGYLSPSTTLKELE